MTAGKCSRCGSDGDLWAWYGQPERQTITVTVSNDGIVTYDYTGVTDSGGDAGEDEQFFCGNCGQLTDTIEEMLGLPPAVVSGKEEGDSKETPWLVTSTPDEPWKEGYLCDTKRVMARNPLDALDIYSTQLGFSEYTYLLASEPESVSMGVDEHGLWATFTNYTIWAIPDAI